MNRIDSKNKRYIWAALALGALVVLAMFDGPLAMVMKLDSENGQMATKLGYWMGHGAIQISFCVLIYLFGGFADIRRFKQAGLQGLAAFLASGLAVQLLKHLVGRPRPRLWLEGVSHIGPTLSGGFDSFPSGHTTTSMALAFVLSYHFPKLTPVFMGLAAFVGASRMLGGSHFPTDIVGGTVLGLAVGWLMMKMMNRTAP